MLIKVSLHSEDIKDQLVHALNDKSSKIHEAKANSTKFIDKLTITGDFNTLFSVIDRTNLKLSNKLDFLDSQLNLIDI